MASLLFGLNPLLPRRQESNKMGRINTNVYNVFAKGLEGDSNNIKQGSI
jgi:hypothetical protein